MLRYIVLVLSTLTSCFALASATHTTHVLTGHPATYAIATALTQGTHIKIERVSPHRLPASRLYSYLTGRGHAKLIPLAEAADAVITLESIWPEDPIYPHTRRANVRIVPIDAGSPLDDALPGIALMEPDNDPSLYRQFQLEPMPANGEQSAPWLSPTALGRMADITARDLSSLSPLEAPKIEENLALIKHELMVQKAMTDQELANADSLVTLALGPHFGYLAADLGLELIGTLTASSREWDEKRLAQLSKWILEEEVAVVLMDSRFATEAILHAIKLSGAQPAVLVDADADTQTPTDWTGENLTIISHAFTQIP